MSNPVEKYIITSQGTVRYWDTDNGKLPVIFIHDLLMCKEVFSKQVSALDNYRMIAIDLPGHGNSDNALISSAYTFTGYSDVINEVLDDLSITDYVIVGWNYGYYIGMELQKIRDGYKGCISIGFNIIHYDQNGGISFGEGDYKRFPNEDYKNILSKEGILDNEDIDNYIAACMMTDMESLKPSVLRVDEKVRETLKERMVTRLANSTNTEIPFIVIAGDGDEGASESILVDGLGDKHNLIENTCHAPFWEKSDEFNTLMVNFLDSLN